MDHINKVEALADWFVCLEVPMRNKDVVMILLEGLSSLYDHLITTLETPVKELTIEYVMTHLMYEMSKERRETPR